MAYTQSALETELNKSRTAATGWPWKLLTLSLAILLTVVAVYLGMRFGFQMYLESRLNSADAEYKRITKSVSSEQQKEVFAFYSQLSNIDTLLRSQLKGSDVLDIVEKNTLKQIALSSLDFSSTGKNLQIKLDGSAPSYDAITQQLQQFKQSPDIQSATLAGSRTVNPGSISFTIQLTFNH